MLTLSLLLPFGIRSLHSSTRNLRKHKTDLDHFTWISKNWSICSGRYVLRDINNPDALLFLTNKEYHDLLKSILSNERDCIVFSTPSNSREDILEEISELSHEGSDTPFNPSGFRRSQMFNCFRGWKIQESMITFKRNFKSFLPSYYKDIVCWFGRTRLSSRDLFIKEMAGRLDRRFKSRGINDTILLYKTIVIVVLNYCSGTPLKSTQELGLRVRLVHGLPKVIPVPLRNLIREGNTFYIRIIVSLFSAYKGFKGTYKPFSTSSITKTLYQYPNWQPSGIISDKFESVITSGESTSQVLTRIRNVSLNVLQLMKFKRGFWENFNPSGLKYPLTPSFDAFKLIYAASPNSRFSSLGIILDALALRANGDILNYYCEYLRLVEEKDIENNFKVDADKFITWIFDICEDIEKSLSSHYDRTSFLTNKPNNIMFGLFGMDDGIDADDMKEELLLTDFENLIRSWTGGLYKNSSFMDIRTAYRVHPLCNGMSLEEALQDPDFAQIPGNVYFHEICQVPIGELWKTFFQNLIKVLQLGKLSLRYESAGKVRVFAIVDYWTQSLLRPMHNALFRILKNHPSDATFDQEGKV